MMFANEERLQRHAWLVHDDRLQNCEACGKLVLRGRHCCAVTDSLLLEEVQLASLETARADAIQASIKANYEESLQQKNGKHSDSRDLIDVSACVQPDNSDD